MIICTGDKKIKRLNLFSIDKFSQMLYSLVIFSVYGRLMIYTVTFNPSLDYYVQVNNVKSGIVNRTTSERLAVGGKVEELGLAHDFIEIDGQSRINVKIKSNTETDINGTGTPVKPTDVNKLIRKLKPLLKNGDWLVICGSVPPSLGNTAYSDLLKKLKLPEGVNLVVDACNGLLTNTLKYRPFLIKPNVYEMCEIFGLTAVPDVEGIYGCARKLQDIGARNVIVSMGSAGAAMVTETRQSLYVRACRGQLVNSVGAGDSMIAGFIHEYLKSGNYFSALNFATAAGSACAFTKNLATKEQIEYVESLML